MSTATFQPRTEPCHHCGGDMLYPSPLRKWCSYRCSNDAYIQRRREWRREARILNCAQCGCQFEAKRRDASFCSPACKQRAYRLRSVTAPGSANLPQPASVTGINVTDTGCGKIAATGIRNMGGSR